LVVWIDKKPSKFIHNRKKEYAHYGWQSIKSR
jgi:hypothetical protein